MKAYKNGFKRAGLPLRELRYKENKNLNKEINMEFENKISDLGFTIDIPKDWIKLDPKNKNCFLWTIPEGSCILFIKYGRI